VVERGCLKTYQFMSKSLY